MRFSLQFFVASYSFDTNSSRIAGLEAREICIRGCVIVNVLGNMDCSLLYMLFFF